MVLQYLVIDRCNYDIKSDAQEEEEESERR